MSIFVEDVAFFGTNADCLMTWRLLVLVSAALILYFKIISIVISALRIEEKIEILKLPGASATVEKV